MNYGRLLDILVDAIGWPLKMTKKAPKEWMRWVAFFPMTLMSIAILLVVVVPLVGAAIGDALNEPR